MKTNKGFAWIPVLLIILGVVVVGGIAYKVSKNNSQPANDVSGDYSFNPTLNDQNSTNPSNLVGGDKDAHGCIGSAGYSWCEVKQKCLRIWEEKCETTPPTSETTNWKTYTIGSLFTFQYPPDWSLVYNDDEGIATLTPPLPQGKNDLIIVRGKQSNCDINFPKCNFITNSTGTIGPFDLETYSTNSATLDMYTKILATFKVNGVKAYIRPQGQ